MNYQEFVGSVTGFLRESLPYGTELKVVPLEKNNGVVMEGLSIRKSGQSVAPTIYLESYYRDYQAGRSLRNIYDQILECCEDCSFMKQFDADFFSDYRKVRPTLVYKLINYEKNRELLERVPHLPFLDLAIVFYCILNDTPVGNATVLIHNSHMQLWNVGCRQLYQDARQNALRLLPAELDSMTDVIRELSDGTDELEDMGVPMYVLTNKRRTQGAVCILYEGILWECYKCIGEDYYILPSSVHEVILIPQSAVANEAELASMVKDINETQVQNTEVLSNHIYCFSSKSGQISIRNI